MQQNLSDLLRIKRGIDDMIAERPRRLESTTIVRKNMVAVIQHTYSILMIDVKCYKNVFVSRKTSPSENFQKAATVEA